MVLAISPQEVSGQDLAEANDTTKGVMTVTMLHVETDIEPVTNGDDA